MPGVSRYIVSATNSAGTVQSNVATLSVVQKVKLAARADEDSRGSLKPALYNVKTAEDIERQRRRLEADKAQKILQRKLQQNKILFIILTMVLIAVVGGFVWRKYTSKRVLKESTEQSHDQASKESLSAPHPTNLQTDSAATPLLMRSSEFDLPKYWKEVTIGDVTNFGVGFNHTESRFNLHATVHASFTNADNIFFVCETNTGKEFHATLEKSSSSSLAGIMLRQSVETNSPFLFIGRSSTNIVVYLSGTKDQPFYIAPIPQQNLRNSLILEFKQININKQWVPVYGFHSNDLQQIGTAAINDGPWLVGLGLSAGNLSSNLEAQFLSVINQ